MNTYLNIYMSIYMYIYIYAYTHCTKPTSQTYLDTKCRPTSTWPRMAARGSHRDLHATCPSLTLIRLTAGKCLRRWRGSLACGVFERMLQVALSWLFWKLNMGPEVKCWLCVGISGLVRRVRNEAAQVAIFGSVHALAHKSPTNARVHLLARHRTFNRQDVWTRRCSYWASRSSFRAHVLNHRV